MIPAVTMSKDDNTNKRRVPSTIFIIIQTRTKIVIIRMQAKVILINVIKYQRRVDQRRAPYRVNCSLLLFPT